MAASIVAAASAKSTNLTDVTSLTISKPTGTAQGDFMVAIVCTYNTTITPPSGWSTVSSAVSGDSNMKSYFFTKTAGASEGSSYQFTWSGGASAAGGIITYRDTSGLSAVGTGSNPAVASATTTDPVTPPAVSNVTNPGFGSIALCWHDNGSTGVTSTGSGTEYWDQSTTDGSPSTHERGTSGYSGGNVGIWKVTSGFDFSPSAAGFSINPTGSITSSVAWTWVIADNVYSTSGASTGGGVTSSGTGSVTSNPAGSGTSTLGGVTSSGTGQQYITGSGGSGGLHVTSDGVGAMQPKGSGTSTLGAGVSGAGVQSSGTAAVAGTKLEVKINGVWTDITTKLRHEQGVTITRGKSSSGSKTVTTTCTFRLDNRGHEFNPFNVNGDYYGYLNRNTEIRMTKQEVGVRFWGEIASYEFGTDVSGNDLYVDVECGGLLRRLEQAGGSEESAIRREILANYSTYSLLNYWPMEEDGGTQFTNIAPATSRAERIKLPMKVDQFGDGYLQFASYSTAECTSAIPQVGLSRVQSRYYGLNPTTSNGTTFTFFLASPGGMTAGTEVFRVAGVKADGTTGTLYVTYSGTDTYSFNYSSPGSSAIVGSLNIPTVGKKGVLFFVCIGPNVAGTAKMKLWYQGVEDPDPVDVCIPIASTDVVDWGGYTLVFNNERAALSDSSSAYVGHLAVWRVSDVPSSTGNTATTLPVFNSLNAYLGEEAHTRFARICDEDGITNSTVGTSSKRMGYQKPGSFVDLLRQCEATDGGILYELRDDFGLGYRTVSSLYNQTSALDLDYDGGHLLGEFKPTYDDQDLANDVTVTREGGSSARYEVTDGRMSTAASPTGIGRYETSETLSLYRDEDAYPQAGWRAWKGSLDEIRVTRLSTGLEVPAVDADDALRTQVLTVDLGDRLTVANCPAWVSLRDNQLDQILDGYTERWDPTEHRWTYNTSPGRAYSVARAKPAVGTGLRVGIQPDSFLIDSDLDGPINSTQTTFEIITYSEDNSQQSLLKLTTTDEPFDIDVEGEQMTVTNVVDVGNYGASYTGHRWTVTVTRSVNGVVKSHPASTLVRLWDRPIIAL